MVPHIVLRQQYKMIISVLTAAARLFIKPGTRGHIYFTAEDRLHSRLLRRPVKIYDAEHDAVVCDGHTVHPKFLHPGNTLFYLI